MRCKAASAPQCEHCKREPTQQRTGYGSQKHIYLGEYLGQFNCDNTITGFYALTSLFLQRYA